MQTVRYLLFSMIIYSSSSFSWFPPIRQDPPRSQGDPTHQLSRDDDSDNHTNHTHSSNKPHPFPGGGHTHCHSPSSPRAWAMFLLW